MRRAVIDIGTNSVKLLIADIQGETVHPLWEGSEQTRLGEGFFQSHQLQFAAIDRTAQAVATFAAQAHTWNVESIRVIATSAARDAVNQWELVKAVSSRSGLEVEVLSGQKEAEWAFAGVGTNAAFANQALLVCDIGGGSTEFALGRGTLQICRGSVPLGTVRMRDQIRPADPPTLQDWNKCRLGLATMLEREATPLLAPHLRGLQSRGVLLVGTGGTTTILAAMELGLTAFDRDRIEQVSFSRQRVWQYQRQLWSLPHEARKKLPGLPANRADVILFGVAIVVLAMETFALDQLRVSTRGLRFAAALAPTADSSGR